MYMVLNGTKFLFVKIKTKWINNQKKKINKILEFKKNEWMDEMNMDLE